MNSDLAQNSYIQRISPVTFFFLSVGTGLAAATCAFFVVGLTATVLGASPALLTLVVLVSSLAGFVGSIVWLRRARRSSLRTTPRLDAEAQSGRLDSATAQLSAKPSPAINTAGQSVEETERPSKSASDHTSISTVASSTGWHRASRRQTSVNLPYPSPLAFWPTFDAGVTEASPSSTSWSSTASR
jgi:hypothetical protein